MKRLLIQRFVYVLTFITVYKPLLAQSGDPAAHLLTIGDNAPELKIETWVKGEAKLEKGRVYLVDFWATWCVPCIAGMPHLSALQVKYKSKGLEVIGITNEDEYGNSLESVMRFVKRKDSSMNYNVAWASVSGNDSLHGIWLHPWMQMSRSGNLPTAFLIDKAGRIAYIGEPLAIDSVLESVMNDRYDPELLKLHYTDGLKSEQLLAKFNASLKAKNIDEAIEYGHQLFSSFSYVKPNTYLIMGWQIAHSQGDMSKELLDMGYEASVRGIKMTRFESPGFLDVLAAIYAAKKDYAAAVISEKLAVSLSEGGMKETQLKNLEKYLTLLHQP